MIHDTPLIATIVAGLGLAFLFGTIVQLVKIPPLVGYLLAGIVVGPFTPGYVADQALAYQLAEIGVILLMFGVGLHFSLSDLLSVRAIALPGALFQMGVATILGFGLALSMGWTAGAGLVFGLALSVASTVVLMRAVQERRLMDTDRGRIAVGWLVVEDLAMVLVLVLLPAVAPSFGGSSDASASEPLATRFGLGLTGVLVLTLLKVALFIGLMLIVGRRVIPWILHYVAHTGSRELFRLAVLAIALSVAFGAASLFGVSLALGAFFAGMILSESTLSQRAAQETLPLRDAFAVLFFVSVGMLFDPVSVVRNPWPMAATLVIIVVGKSVAAFLIVLAFGRPLATAFTISASLAQVGEFSFILAELGVALRLLPLQARDFILGGAILSILLNPLMFAVADRLSRRFAIQTDSADAATPAAPPPTELVDHTVLVGYGRVGKIIATALRDKEEPFLVIEASEPLIAELREANIEVIPGNAVRSDVLKAANLSDAKNIITAIPEAFEAGQIVQQARAANSEIHIIARAHSDAEVDHLNSLGADAVVMGEREIAREMLQDLFSRRELPLGAVAPAAPTDPEEA
jgi:monovalent cation:H+ antiporter-2, CPA2 family